MTSGIMITPSSLAEPIRERMRIVADAYQSEQDDLSSVVSDLLAQLDQPQSAQDALTALHRLQRFATVAALDIHHHPKIREALTDTDKFPLWEQYAAFDTHDTNIEKLAQALYNGDAQRRSPILLSLTNDSRFVPEKIVEYCVRDDMELDIRVVDPVFDRRILHCVDTETAAKFGVMVAMHREYAQRLIGFNHNNTGFNMIDPAPETIIADAYDQAWSSRRRAYGSDTFFTVTRVPTPYMAEIDRIPYNEYIDGFCRMADVDNRELKAVNEIFVDILNNAKNISLYNNDGTDFHISVDGFDAVNSATERNIPGGEAFTAPEKYSASGKIVAKGAFVSPQNGYVMRDLTLVFEQGKIVDAKAEEGEEHLLNILNKDEGVRYLGEFAIGTNWAFKTHISNTLLVEKIGGSFHVALGNAYKNRTENGRHIRLDNGNESQIHWDIAIMLFGKNGRIIVDGKPIMEDGLYLDPRLSKLNMPV